MTFFPEPLKPSEGRKDDEIIIDPIESDKKGKEENPMGKDSAKEQFEGAILLLLKQFIQSFSREQQQDAFRDALTSDIVSFEKLLNQLKEFDQSKNATFSQHLSDLWHSLLQHVHLVNVTKTKLKSNLAQLKIVLSDIDHYPPNEDHQLGFYLTQYTGEKWLPAPFMEILKKLHEDYKANKASSILEKWTNLLQQSTSPHPPKSKN